MVRPVQAIDPIIEKVVKSAGGKVKLVKINIDEHPQIPGQLGIKSIPAVIAFQRGQPVDGFMGALPESQVKQFIERLVGPLGAGDEDFAAAEAALKEGDAEGAAEIYRALLEEDPAEPRALGGLAQALVALAKPTRPGKSSIPPRVVITPRSTPPVQPSRLRSRPAMSGIWPVSRRLSPETWGSPGPLRPRHRSECARPRGPAADRLLEIIKADLTGTTMAPQAACPVFEAWGPIGPATLAARRRLLDASLLLRPALRLAASLRIERVAR